MLSNHDVIDPSSDYIRYPRVLLSDFLMRVGIPEISDTQRWILGPTILMQPNLRAHVVQPFLSDAMSRVSG